LISDSVAAVVITYNRLELLKKVIAGLLNQTKEVDKIIVINNGSTDGTLDYLQELEKDNSKIKVITQENLGGSGGQFTGFKVAFEMGYEWIWQMDDDVVVRLNCLEELFKVRQKELIYSPLRYSVDGTVFYNETIKFNLTNPFKSFWLQVISQKDLDKDFIPAEGLTFEGAFLHRSVIEKIGLPQKNFFIFADDSDFFIRAKKAGFTPGILTSAKLDRLLLAEPFKLMHTPRRYYFIRNQIAVDRMHGNFVVKNLRPLIYFVKWIFRSNSFSDIKYTIKAFVDGWFYKSYDGIEIINEIIKNGQ
jgi:GT2 family glycosyltransferase